MREVENKEPVVKGDPIPEVSVLHRNLLVDAHQVLKNGSKSAEILAKETFKNMLESMLLKEGNYDGVVWIIKPFVSLTYRSKDGNVMIGLRLFSNEICSTTLGATKLGESLTFDAFIAKAKIYVGYDADKTGIVYQGTACYRKVPSLSWRCVTTGEKMLLHL